MKNYQIRVVEERDELRGKINRLEAFIENREKATEPSSVGPEEISRMRRQLSVMKDYVSILNERIDNFTE